MLEKKIGFIGYGNIAQAMIKGFLKNDKFIKNKIFVYDHKLEINNKFIIQKGVISKNITELLNIVDILFITVKPNIILNLLKKIKNQLKKDKIIISVAAGITLKSLENILGKEHKIIRAMPNIATLVNESITAITSNKIISLEENKEIIEIFNILGKTVIINENLMDTVIGISSSAVIYVFILVEAMSDAAVLSGMSRDQSYYFAYQTVKGAIEIMIDTNKHPGELKDMVCSPGGTTIEAIRSLEKKNFRSSIIESILKSIKKAKKISRNYS